LGQITDKIERILSSQQNGGFMSLKKEFSFLSKLCTISMLALAAYTPNALAYEDKDIEGVDKIPVYPKNKAGSKDAGVKEFDWQEEWGSIHMNTFSDGLQDPGQPTTEDSNLACPDSASLCNNDGIMGDADTKVQKIEPSDQTQSVHGIKYDIKNSILNCMGRITPTFPSNNGGWRHQYSAAVCDKPSGSPLAHPHYHGKPKIRYNPVWDPRGNDFLSTNRGALSAAGTPHLYRGYAGCSQQISNSCANDIHECRATPDPAGGEIAEDTKPWEFPVTHSFYPREVEDLVDSGMEGMKLPKVYYEYTKPGVDQHPFTRNAILHRATGDDPNRAYDGNIRYLNENGYETEEIEELARNLASELDGKSEAEIKAAIKERFSGLEDEEIEMEGSSVPEGDYILVREEVKKNQDNPEYTQCVADANAEQTSNDPVAAHVYIDGAIVPSGGAECNPASDSEWEEKWENKECGMQSKITFKGSGEIKDVLPWCEKFSDSDKTLMVAQGKCWDGGETVGYPGEVRLVTGIVSSSIDACRTQSNLEDLYADGECGFLFLETPDNTTTVAACNSIEKKIDKNVKIYRKVTSTRIGLSVTPNPPDMVLNKDKTYEVREIKVYDEDLARIKAYEVPVTAGDVANFIVVDPQNFFDLRDYVAGGRYDANYEQFDEDGNPATYDTCPILGLPNGYSGICDPKGEAGCNLPIYGVGAETTFEDAEERTYTYNSFPVKWSGYVKSWKWITVNEYKKNTADRLGQNGGALYALDADLNDNLVLMTVRSNEYCDRRERYSGQINPIKSPDLPCVQYWQYQNIDPNNASDWSFVNLFMPQFDGAFETQYGYTYLDLFPVLEKEDGTKVPYMYDIYDLFSEYGKEDLAVVQCDPNQDECKGTSNFVETKKATANRLVNFFDKKTKLPLIRHDGFSASVQGTRTAIDNENIGIYKESDELMKSKDGGASIGEYISEGDDSSGLHLKLKPGRVLAMRLMPEDQNERNSEYDENGKLVRASTRCVIAQNKSLNPDSSAYFIPTNSEEEIKAFANATDEDIEIRPCGGSFMTHDQAAPPKPAVNPNGTETWFGTLSCEQLTTKPACNQTKFITAERFCILEDGKMGDCEECLHAADPDAGIDFTLASVAPMGNAQLLSIPGDENGGSRCYFSAACFAQNGDGCPSAETSGGHVFCLSEDTKIQMADNSEKEIGKIKAGEEVMAFSSKESKKNGLIKSKVVATAITQDQKYMILKTHDPKSGKETTLRITPQHKVVLSSGRGVEVRDLQAGVPILMASGQPVVVKSVEESEESITVYNLILEDHADGYIAGGLRVLSYPLLDGIKKNMQASKN
jgi:hypothetical protein